MKGELVSGYDLAVIREGNPGTGKWRYRSELWWKPYGGWMVAYTRWVSAEGQAKKDGAKYLRVPVRK